MFNLFFKEELHKLDIINKGIEYFRNMLPKPHAMEMIYRLKQKQRILEEEIFNSWEKYYQRSEENDAE